MTATETGHPSDDVRGPDRRAWRASGELGMVDGLKAFRAELAAGGQPASHVNLATAAIGSRVLSMTARGALLKPRLAHAAGIPLIGRGVRVRGAHQISVGSRLRVEEGVELQGTSRKGLVLGNGVTIGAYTMIRPTNYYGRTIGVGLTVGDRTSFSPSCFIGCLGGVTIGSDVMFGPGVMVFAENHVFDGDEATIKSQGLDYAPVVIEDDCWIASRVVITGGVTIGRGSVIGAGSVVTKDVPPGSVAAGVPAKVIRSRLPHEQPL